MPLVGRSVNLRLASSNPGKLEEFRALASGTALTLDLLPEFHALPAFPETAPTIAENAAGKAIYYSRAASGLVFADDSGLVVPQLAGAPGVHSSRYAGPEGDAKKNIEKLLAALAGNVGEARRARFVCVLALARHGRVLAVLSGAVSGRILEAPRGAGGFGYDPVFFYEPLEKSFAELTREEKNRLSHRGQAFRKLAQFLESFSG